MCGLVTTHHGTRHSGNRLGVTKQGPILDINHTISDVHLDDLCQKDQTSVASDSSQDILGIVYPWDHSIKVLPEPSDTVFKHSYIYNEKGAKFLAKDALSSVPLKRTMIQQNGRIYQGQKLDSYLLPCDEMEQDRLDFLHAVFMLALRSTQLLHVPHTSNGRFLDLGCGTGIWAIEVAKAYPDAYVLGLDISSIQPESIPLNCVFKAPYDYELPWLIGEGQWDIIHMRMGCGSVMNWPNLYKRIFDHLRGGAWFEQLEIDFEPRCNSRSLKGTWLNFWYQNLKAATKQSRREIAHSPEQTLHWLRKAGFNVSHEKVVLPLNPWKQPIHAQAVARWYNTAFVESIEPLCLAPFGRVHGWTKEQIQTTVAATMEEALDVDMDAFHTLHLYKARKPDRRLA